MSIVVIALAFVTSLAAFWRAWLDHTTLQRKLYTLKLEAAELQQRLNRRGRLAGEVAHEIKNPITAIQCSAQTLDLMVGDTLTPDLRKSLRYINEYSDYLLKLLSDFLEVSRCEAGANNPRPEVVQVREAIEAVAGLLRSSAQKKHITLTFSVPDDICAWIDPRHFKQVLFNLLHNSIKFTPEHGSVEIGVRQIPHDRTLAIEVRDTGCGIPEDQQATIFDPYTQHTQTQCDQGAEFMNTGVGLGLALCRNLVELNGGDIAVESSEGTGSTFCFTIPKAATVTMVTQAPVALPLPAQSSFYQPLLGQSFLLVDDDPATGDAIAGLIQAWGGAVDQVAQATEAIEAITAKSYDAVMVDNTLDGLNGYELASLLRDNAHARGTTIIIATKNSPDEDRAQECGADRTIEKPLRGELLLQSLLNSGKYHPTH